MDLYKEVNYSANIPFLIGRVIREYDITKANINVLYKYGILSKKKYEYLSKCPRMERQVIIGNMERANPKITDIKRQGIEESKKLLFEINKVKDYEVLSIKNDAVFIIDRPLRVTKFDNIEFLNKNSYTSFYNINNIEYYYLYDALNDIEKMDIKGISDENVKLHEPYFIDFLLCCFQSAELSSIEDTLQLISDFNRMYTNLELDTGYYRNMDAESMYEIVLKKRCYKLENIEDKNKKYINIMCNLNIIRTLWKYIGSLKFKYK